MERLDIGIVGGSISGTAAAGALLEHGHRVRIFERSSAELEDRGLGIAMDPRVSARLGDDSGVAIDHRLVVDREGVVRWRRPIGKRTFRWSVVHRAVAQPLPGGMVETGSEVVEVGGDEHHAWIQLRSGERCGFDLVVGADGIGSRVRSAVDPRFVPEYLGYVAIRGLVPAAAVASRGGGVLEELVEGAMVNGYLDRSHVAAYPIRAADGTLHVNWMWYRNVEDRDLEAFMTDIGGKAHRWSVPPDAVPEDRVRGIRRDAAVEMSSELAAIVEATESLSMQAIHGGSASRRVVGRFALVGDAARVAIPHVGAGTSLAIMDAWTLADAIEGSKEGLPDRLGEWDAARRAETSGVMDFGRDLGRYLQFDGADWTTWTEEDFDRWWTGLLGGRRMYFESS